MCAGLPTASLNSLAKLSVVLWLIGSRCVLAQPAALPFHDCFSGNDTFKLNVSTVYAQILNNNQMGTYLNLTVFGETPQDIMGFSNESTNLATLFTTTSILTLDVFMNSSYFCSTLRPPSPLPARKNSTSFCPLPAGPFGFSSSIPWGANRELTTLDTRLRAVDPFSNELLCFDVYTTPLQPGPLDSPYGRAVIISWVTVFLAISYWLVVGIARIVSSAWSRGVARPGGGVVARIESAGFILASALSGERLAASPALMRFCTPSTRDIIFHTQWCAVLAMVAVQWPAFVYPLLTRAAWATLSYNITLTDSRGAQSHHWDPLLAAPFSPPAGFLDQISDPTSPLYVDVSLPNTLFTLPSDAHPGISSFAYTIGLRPQDLFGVCLTLFLAIIAGTVTISLVVWSLDWLMASIRDSFGAGSHHARLTGSRSPGFSASRDIDSPGAIANMDENKNTNGHSLFRVTSRLNQSAIFWKSWWRRTRINSFHGSVLHGNLVRILLLFHLPVTIFSTYQMTLPRSHASLSSIVLAAFSFVIFSLIIPVLLVLRVTFTTTNKLYDETRTLLSLGPLYSHYRHGSQLFASLFFTTNFAFGVVVGCGQKDGTAQAIIILVIEVISALVTSVWLPWGHGASMGLISFLFCVARIVVAVLLVLLSPVISIGEGAGSWIAYGILIVLALVYCGFTLILIVKIIEAALRIFGGIGFDRSTHVVDSGLLGTCGLLGFCGPPRRRRSRRRYRATDVPNTDLNYSPRPVPGVGMSIHSASPPSVLRPEHALRPYREDSDDEDGHIMGAWQPFPRPAYQAVDDLPTAAQNASGFSRVGGGRAHYDSPYAITSGSTHAFPSVERPNYASSSRIPYGEDDLLSSSISRNHVTTLPPGAMQPVHVRTKSQTAIIEDTPINLDDPLSSHKAQMSSEDPSSSVFTPPVVVTSADSDSDAGHSTKKRWYQLRKGRPRSEGSALPENDNPGLLSPSSPTQAGGRSFVVIRGSRPQQKAAAGPSHTPRPGTSPSSLPDSTSPPGSFMVLRGDGSSVARGVHAST